MHFYIHRLLSHGRSIEIFKKTNPIDLTSCLLVVAFNTTYIVSSRAIQCILRLLRDLNGFASRASRPCCTEKMQPVGSKG